MEFVKLLTENGSDTGIIRHIPVRDRAYFPIQQKEKPWLEQDFNLLTTALTEYIREFVKGYAGSGFLLTGAFAFPGTPANTFEMAESRVTLDGNVCHVGNPDQTANKNVITINAPPGAGTRDDLVFLECWWAEVARTGATFGSTSIHKFGGKDNGVYTNDIQDPTMLANAGILETTRRAQLRWRIRIVDGVDFTTYPNGVNDPIVLARAEKGSPVATYTFSSISDEKGKLFRAGAGNATSVDALDAVDGYVYATPICKVARTAGDTTVGVGEVTDLRATIASLYVGFAPDSAEYIVLNANAGLTSEKVLKDTIIMSGAASSAPLASLVPGALYYATDGETAITTLDPNGAFSESQGRLLRSDGTNWKLISRVPQGAEEAWISGNEWGFR